jgi:hypothetical protein
MSLSPGANERIWAKLSLAHWNEEVEWMEEGTRRGVRSEEKGVGGLAVGIGRGAADVEEMSGLT